MKDEFIKKWSTWWMLQINHKELTEDFEKELNDIIERNIDESYEDRLGAEIGKMSDEEFEEIKRPELNSHLRNN